MAKESLPQSDVDSELLRLAGQIAALRSALALAVIELAPNSRFRERFARGCSAAAAEFASKRGQSESLNHSFRGAEEVWSVLTNIIADGTPVIESRGHDA